jgi:hypothetical protein
MAIVDQAVDLQPQQRVNSNSNSNNKEALQKRLEYFPWRA